MAGKAKWWCGECVTWVEALRHDPDPPTCPSCNGEFDRYTERRYSLPAGAR